MLRLTVHTMQERVLLSVQTRDRNGHVVDATDPFDVDTWGATPSLGYSGTEGANLPFPVVDIERMGAFDSILRENDIVSHPLLPAFYDYTMVMSKDGFPWVQAFIVDPADATKSLAMYFGSEFSFDSIFFKLGAAAAFTSATLNIEYWDGIQWTAVTGRSDGPLLGSLNGQSDQATWDMPTNWFPCRIQHIKSGAEGSRQVHPRSMFWIRVRYTSIVGSYTSPRLYGAWQGEPAAIDDTSLWQNVQRPNKLVLVRSPMMKNQNVHLSEVQVVSRKAPADRETGLMNFGVGDYTLAIPTDVSGTLATDPAMVEYLTQVPDRDEALTTFPVPTSGIVLRPGRYRARAIAEIPNVDFRVLAEQTGHTVPAPGPSPEFGGEDIDPSDPESLFDPSWQPMLTAVSEDFDVRSQGVVHIDMQRTLSGSDSYVFWLEIDGKVVPLRNQSNHERDYGRLVIIDASSGARVIDTMSGSLSLTGLVLHPQIGVSGIDQDSFRYVETNVGRLMQNGGQYLATAMIVRGGEAFISRVVFNFLE